MHLCVQVRVYELGQLSLKFERHFDAEIIDFQVRRHAEAFTCASSHCLKSRQSVLLLPPDLMHGMAAHPHRAPFQGGLTVQRLVFLLHAPDLAMLCVSALPTVQAFTVIIPDLTLEVAVDPHRGLFQGGLSMRGPLSGATCKVWPALQHSHSPLWARPGI